MIHYRTVQSRDIPSLAKIRAAEWETETYWLRRINGYLTGELNPHLALKPRVLFVAIDVETIVGFIAGNLTQRLQCEGELEWINVIPAFRQQGIASALIKELFKWFIEQKAYKV